MSGLQILTTLLILLYLLFLAWYDGWWQSNLQPAEVDAYVVQLPQSSEAEQLREILRQFGTTDDGKEFFMLNLNTYASGVSGSSNADYAAYTNAVMPLLLWRASHPIYASQGLQSLVNPRYDQPWQEVVLVRYRSRRDFISMITSEAYRKITGTRSAGIKYAEVFPTGPSLNLASPRLYIALFLVGIGAFLHMCLKGRPRYERNQHQ